MFKHQKMYIRSPLGGCLFPTCNMFTLKVDASFIMIIEKKHQKHSVQIPGKEENTQQEGCALLKAVLCALEAISREQMDFVCISQQIYQETLKENTLSKQEFFDRVHYIKWS